MEGSGIAQKPNSSGQNQNYNIADGKYAKQDGTTEAKSERPKLQESERIRPRDVNKFVHKDEIGEFEEHILRLADEGKPMDVQEFEKSKAYRKGSEDYAEWAKTHAIDRIDPNYTAILGKTYEEARKFLIGEDVPYPIKKERKASIIVGFPASGKTSSLAALCNEEMGYAELDSDIIKRNAETLREAYNGGLGAGCVQMPSADALQLVIDEAIGEGMNMALPMVASNEEEFTKLLKKLDQNGYEISVEVNGTSIGVCLPRILRRFIESGRYLPPPYISHCMTSCRKIYDSISKQYEQGGTINGIPIKRFKRT